MRSVDEVGEEFFDSVDYLSSEESSSGVKDNFGYEIWLSEPQSVKERRIGFLRRMGLAEIDRMTECSGAVYGSSSIVEEGSLDGDEREFNGEANCMADEFGDDCNGDFFSVLENETAGHSLLAERSIPEDLGNRAVKLPGTAASNSHKKKDIHVCDWEKVSLPKNKMARWWKQFTRQMGKTKRRHGLDVPKESAEAGRFTRVEVQQNKKHFKELTGVYAGQNIHAHKGLIWTMKFSPDGQFLASGGEDGVVRIWRVTLTDCPYKATDCNHYGLNKDTKLRRRKQSSHAAIILPEKVLQIEESPLQEFHGHSSDVLDLAWSSSNLLLSSSKDGTVRLWQVDSDKCIDVYKHSNYVTCIQFNPVDENYFISGSIDGKIRVWGVREKRVVHWADVHDIVTALCYQPNAKGFAVGSISGTYRFYEALGSELLLNREYQIHGRKKTTGNRITGIQFVDKYPQKVMITSEDSKIRLLDGLEVVQKYKGLAKSGSQMSASFASTGNHIVSVGDDSRIYIWNYDEMHNQSSRQVRSSRSCEHFVSDAVSVAIPWSGTGAEQIDSLKVCSCLPNPDHGETPLPLRDSGRFSLSNWFSMDGSSRGSSVTWPEEKLPVLDLPSSENGGCCLHQHLQHENMKDKHQGLSTTWGLAIVAAGWDGTIRTFQNFGLPVRT